MSELRPYKPEAQSREAVIAGLVAIADAGRHPRSLEELKDFAADTDVRGAFLAAVSRLGHNDTWFGTLIRGARAGQDRFVSANFQTPPALNGASMLHVYAYEGQDPSFGVLLPFDETGELDTSRPISASSFMSAGKTFAFLPEEWVEESQKPDSLFTKTELSAAEVAETASQIALITEMAAATLVTLLELEDVSAEPGLASAA